MNRYVVICPVVEDVESFDMPHPVLFDGTKEEFANYLSQAYSSLASDGRGYRGLDAGGQLQFVPGTNLFAYSLGVQTWADPLDTSKGVRFEYRRPTILTVDEWFKGAA